MPTNYTVLVRRHELKCLADEYPKHVIAFADPDKRRCEFYEDAAFLADMLMPRPGWAPGGELAYRELDTPDAHNLMGKLCGTFGNPCLIVHRRNSGEQWKPLAWWDPCPLPE